MKSEASSRRPVRQATTQRRIHYLDPDTDDDSDINHDAQEDYSDGQDQTPEPEPEPRPKRQRTTTTKKQQSKLTRAKPKKTSRIPKKSPPSRKTKLSKQSAPAAPPVTPIPSSGVIPKWQDLPYEILLSIFTHALAAELEHENGVVANRRANHPNTWIMRTARKLCHAFAEPALTAFYRSPNLSTAHLSTARWLEGLSSLVKQPNHQLLYAYNMKVTSLEVPASSLYLFAKSSTSAFSDLISNLPRLDTLLITHPLDEVPHDFQGRSHWKYPMDLFDTLDQSKNHLDCWRWNVHLVEQPDGNMNFQRLTQFMADVHQRPSFQSLRHLTIAHLPAIALDSVEFEQEEAADVDFGKIFVHLPNLKSLSFECCDRLSAPMLLELPKTLETVRFINCMPLESDMLGEFLTSHGHLIKELVLDHNPFLDLAFFTGLRKTCPNLRSLKMDLFDHRENRFRHLGEPKYENLLLEDEVPTWPSSLTSLELVHMQRWGANAAQNFFRSIVESADSLPHLRKLILQAHINISWRDRAAFRDQWIERLRRVYQRHSPEPDPKLASLEAFRQWKAAQADTTASDDEPLAKRRGRRESDRNKEDGGRGGAGAGGASATRRGGETWRNEPERFIQALCHVVDIRIDNQRPREEQLNETHFLDSEPSGDEDWTEGAELVGEEYAW